MGDIREAAEIEPIREPCSRDKARLENRIKPSARILSTPLVAFLLSMGTQRYFSDDVQLLQAPAPYEELLASLTRINLYNPPVQTCSTGWKFKGFASGPTSIAYLFFRLSSLYPDLMFKGQSPLDWSEAYLDVGVHGGPSEVNPSHCGIMNETLAQLTLRAVIWKDASLAQRLCLYSSEINKVQEQGSNEWMFGRAGYLYFLRLARSAFDADNDGAIRTSIDGTIEKVVERILSSPVPWTWYGKEYLGAAHGSIGIITQLVLSSGSSTQAEGILSRLLESQFPSGNFPSLLPNSSDELVQFCHGGPGFVLSLVSLRPYFPILHAKIDAAITSARKDIWERGLLTKTPCLCHGIAGNALALQGPQRDHFLTYMSSEPLEKNGWLDTAKRNESFAGLYVGEAGRAWAWALADKKLPSTCIGFNDL